MIDVSEFFGFAAYYAETGSDMAPRAKDTTSQAESFVTWKDGCQVFNMALSGDCTEFFLYQLYEEAAAF